MGSRMRITRGATGDRRSHHKAAKPRLAEDKAGDLHVRHHVSPATGTYKGRQIVDVSKRQARLERKAEEKRQARSGQADETGGEKAEEQEPELDPTELSKK